MKRRSRRAKGRGVEGQEGGVNPRHGLEDEPQPAGQGAAEAGVFGSAPQAQGVVEGDLECQM